MLSVSRSRICSFNTGNSEDTNPRKLVWYLYIYVLFYPCVLWFDLRKRLYNNCYEKSFEPLLVD